MFHSISWSSYWKAMLVLLVVYYVLIFIFYGRGMLLQKLKLQLTGRSLVSVDVGIRTRSEDEIRAFITQAGLQSLAKEEIIFGLRRLLDSFTIEQKEIESIKVIIIKECEDHCSFHLSEEDLRVLWR